MRALQRRVAIDDFRSLTRAPSRSFRSKSVSWSFDGEATPVDRALNAHAVALLDEFLGTRPIFIN